MSDTAQQAGGTGPSHRGTELGVAVIMALLGLITIVGSLQVGIGWGPEGPKSGFFPFYIGVIIILASAVNLAQAWFERSRALFAEWSQLRQVFAVVVPTTIYVFAISYAGIYLASAALIAIFMVWLGRYRWPIAAAVAVGVPVVMFLMFEKWFLVPLPKGPVEALFGY
jgi:putative tricarboxylic transport membrane protein